MSRYLPAVAFGACAILTADIINRHVTEPYMDEIMHIGQARAYCRGDWTTWDSRLTTPPGLYLVSVAASRALAFTSWSDLCSPPTLRRVNLVFLLLLPWLYLRLLPLVRRQPTLRSSTKDKATPSKLAQLSAAERDEALEAVVVASFPVAFFFGFLYYTDLGSLVMVLASLDKGSRQRWAASAVLGAASLLFRQTNIVWLAYIAAASVVRQLQLSGDLVDPPLASAGLLDIPRSVLSLAAQSPRHVRQVAPALAAYLPVFIAAAAFVHWNGGIVLGDKHNHVPVLHAAQMLYFVAFTAAFSSPATLTVRSLKMAAGNLAGSPSRIVRSTILLAGIISIVHTYTLAHPFLLSDNRHYSFYVWRRIINVHPFARYALAPGYLVAGRLLYDHLAASATLTLLPTLFFTAATALTLVPSPLIEPRYFIVPFVLLRLHLRPRPGSPSPSPTASRMTTLRRRRLLVELACYVAVNIATIWLFVYKPFRWPAPRTQDETGLMRFMW